MKLFLSTLTFSILLTACSSQNAFSKFDMDKQQELSISNSQTSKIKHNNAVDGIFSAIYLNGIDSRLYSDNEYFYVSMYIKDLKSLSDEEYVESMRSSLTLNAKTAIDIEQLPHANKFSNLTSVNNKWNKYFLVIFKKDAQESIKKLHLLFKKGNSSSEVLAYPKR